MSIIARSAVIGAFLAVASAPALADVRSGVEAYQRGNYAAALAEWRPLADRGDADAQFNLAQAYRLGRGVPANTDTAVGLYRRAAQQNHAEAGALLGLTLFQNGKRAEAMPWLGKAADAGDSASQYVYGTALFNGDMVTKDYTRAYNLMTQAAAQGLPPARSALIEMDKFIPLAQRQQGAAAARTAVASRSVTGATTSAPVRTAAVSPVARATPRPVAATQGPPVRPATPAARPAASRTVPPRASPRSVPVRAVAAPAATRIAGWKVQLGAFSQPASATALFTSLQGRVRALSGTRPLLVRAGAVTRLQAGPFANRAAAASACAAVTAASGQACFPVAP